MGKIWILLIGFVAISLHLQAQDKLPVHHGGLMWFDVFENIKFGEKWQLQTEATERFFVGPAEQWQFGARAHGMYWFNESGSVGPGFSVWFPKAGNVTTHELRVSQQFSYRHKLKKRNRVVLPHRFLLEERFVRNIVGGELADDYRFLLRFRYRFGIEYTLAEIGEKNLQLKFYLNDELFLQAGKNATNIFDQNRFNTGIAFTVAKGTSIWVGYANLYRKLLTSHDVAHTFRVSFMHDLSVGKRK